MPVRFWLPPSKGGEVLGATEVLNKRNGLLFEEPDRLRLARLYKVAGRFALRND